MPQQVETSDTVQRPDVHLAKDARTRERMTVQYLPAVHRLCRRYQQSGVPIEDLVQVGSLGLLKAIDKFDPDRGYKFLSFAVPVILGEIKNYFRDHGWAIKIPRMLQRQKMQVERAVESLSQLRGRSPTIDEIAEATGLPTEAVYDTFEVANYGKQLSLDASYDRNGQAEGSTLMEVLGSLDAELEVLPDRLDLISTLSRLPDRERRIVELKFLDGLSQVEIASRLGISQMHVSRLQRQALSKLRVTLNAGL